jgi:hypothetical protein
MAIVTPTEMAAAEKSSPMMIFSPIRGLDARSEFLVEPLRAPWIDELMNDSPKPSIRLLIRFY